MQLLIYSSIFFYHSAYSFKTREMFQSFLFHPISWQGCILLPCLFNLYALYVKQNAKLNEAQAGIKIFWRNINNLRYADDPILRVEGEEELKSLLMKVKEEIDKTALKLSIKKTKIMALDPITSCK